MRSMPMLIAPALPTSTSPRAASSRGVAATKVEWRRAPLLANRSERKSMDTECGMQIVGYVNENLCERVVFPAKDSLHCFRTVGGQEEYYRGLDDRHEHRRHTSDPLHRTGPRFQGTEEQCGQDHANGRALANQGYRNGRVAIAGRKLLVHALRDTADFNAAREAGKRAAEEKGESDLSLDPKPGETSGAWIGTRGSQFETCLCAKEEEPHPSCD